MAATAGNEKFNLIVNKNKSGICHLIITKVNINNGLNDQERDD